MNQNKSKGQINESLSTGADNLNDNILNKIAPQTVN